MLAWPASHIAKCLVFYHPADDIDLRLQQEDRVKQLYADCAALNRDLLLEVIATAHGQACDDTTVANAMRRFYNLGVYPTWWKLASQTSAGWGNIAEVIESYDPLCHGVIMLGLDAPKDELRESFQRAAPFAVCKGFAVGRSIFGEAARKWFNDEMDDSGVIELVADNYLSMIRFWQEATADAKRVGNQAAAVPSRK
jgi:5-dehydro-2-deoxygluconokinase